MKKKKYVIILAIGLLAMNIGAASNLIFKTNINIDIIDFMRGFGIVLLAFGAYKIVNSKRNLGTS